MRNHVLHIMIALLLAVTSWAQTHPSSLQWEHLPAMPAGVFDAAISQSGQVVVITGGITQAGTTSDLVQLFDLNRQSWRTLHMPQGVCHHAQVTLPDGRVLVVGGQTGQVPHQLTPVKLAWLVDPQAQNVAPTAPLPGPAIDPSAHLLPDGRAMVIAGRQAAIFDPAQSTWVRYIALRRSRQTHASLLLDDGRVLVVGGQHRKSLEIIDPKRGHSTMLAVKLPSSTDDLRVVALPQNRVWILGGQNSQTGDTTEQTWVLDLGKTGQSLPEAGPPLGVPRGMADFVVAATGPWVIAAGGESQHHGHDSELTDARLLDTRTLAIWSLPSLPRACDDAVAIATSRGIILFGGYLVRGGFIQRLDLPIASKMVLRLELPENAF